MVRTTSSTAGPMAAMSKAATVLWTVANAFHMANGAFVPRGVAASDNICIDMDNANPPALRFGYPTWRTSDNPNCQPPLELGGDGECFQHLRPDNNCTAFCQLSNTWFYGAPIDTMDGRYCERGEECGRTVSVGVTDGKTITTDVGESYTATNATSDSRTYTTTLGISFDIPPGMGGIEIPLPKGSELTGLGVPKAGVTYSKAYAKALSWTQTVARGHTFSVSNSTSYSLNIGESDSLSRPSWSQGYCGSWFAVPVIGLSCGRGARGDLVPSDRGGGSQCLLNPEDSAFSHCFNYTFTDNRLPGQTKHKTVFVLRDCDQGFILPGEWQHPVFAYSFLPQTLVTDHILRYGWKEFPDTRNKPRDDEWVHQKHLMNFTKTLGPVDHTVELCGRGKYCSRHKLTPGNCYNIPRGYAGTRSSYIVSAKTTPGNCCVLFSRQECHGVAQVVKGDIPDFFAVGYEGQAHSVVCNVEEYCNPNIIDSLTLS